MRSVLVLGVVCLAFASGCSLGQGSGDIQSDNLIALGTDPAGRDACWNGAYHLVPNFFAANPYRDTQSIRIQRGTDVEEVSDGLEVLVDDTPKILEAVRQAILANQPPPSWDVSLPVGLHAPGTPIQPPIIRKGGQPPIVHLALYLQYSCHNQNTILYAVSGSVTFDSLFSGDPNEKNASAKYTEATFDVMIGDPRDAPLGKQAYEIPAEKQSHLTGNFQFYFERGQPAQPFP